MGCPWFLKNENRLYLHTLYKVACGLWRVANSGFVCIGSPSLARASCAPKKTCLVSEMLPSQSSIPYVVGGRKVVCDAAKSA